MDKKALLVFAPGEKILVPPPYLVPCFSPVHHSRQLSKIELNLIGSASVRIRLGMHTIWNMNNAFFDNFLPFPSPKGRVLQGLTHSEERTS